MRQECAFVDGTGLPTKPSYLEVLGSSPPPNSTSKPFSHCYIFTAVETTRDVLFHDWYQKPIMSSEAELYFD